MRRLACSLNVDSLYAIPPRIVRKEEVASALAGILKLDKEMLVERLNREKVFVWLKRKLSPEETKRVRALNIEGIALIKESKRFYPNSNLASHLLGFVDIDNKGLEGVELFYERYLRGEMGWREAVRDAKGREIFSEDMKSLPACNGYNVILTIDEIIQHITEKALDAAWHKYNAKAAMAIVMNPHNGQILALANRPTFDPNYFSDTPEEHRRNRVVTDSFEPGSAFKIVTASAALNENIVTFEDIFYCENGSYNIGGHLLHDHRPHANLTFKEVIEKSSNIGTVKVALLLKEKNLYRYIQRFGFGSSTGIDMPGEISGILRPESQWSKFSISAVPMGQEVGVTAVQMVSAISVIANGGIYYRPMVVKEIQDERAQSIKIFEANHIRQVISEDTAMKMKEILRGVVENGTGKSAQLKKHTSGGKTGTAQKIEPSGKYSHSKFLSSFIGFAPVEDPKIAIGIFIDEPRPVYYGGVVAAPVFKEIAEATLKYLELEKDGIIDPVRSSERNLKYGNF